MGKAPQGLGRCDVLKKGLPDVHDELDMHNLMAKIFYSYMFRDFPINQPYLHADFRSDQTFSIPVNEKGEVDREHGDVNRCTIDWVMDPKNEAALNQACYEDAYMYLVLMTETQRRATHEFWYSTIHNVVNVNKGTMTFQLWKDPYMTYTMRSGSK